MMEKFINSKIKKKIHFSEKKIIFFINVEINHRFGMPKEWKSSIIGCVCFVLHGPPPCDHTSPCDCISDSFPTCLSTKLSI